MIVGGAMIDHNMADDAAAAITTTGGAGYMCCADAATDSKSRIF